MSELLPSNNPDYIYRHPGAVTDVDLAHDMASRSNERRTAARSLRQGGRLAVEASRYEASERGVGFGSMADYITERSQKERSEERGLLGVDTDAAQNIARGHRAQLLAKGGRQEVVNHYDAIADQIDEQANRLEEDVRENYKPYQKK